MTLSKTTLSLVTVAVLGFGVVAHGQNASTVITIKARQVAANGQGRGFTIRIGDVATLGGSVRA